MDIIRLVGLGMSLHINGVNSGRNPNAFSGADAAEQRSEQRGLPGTNNLQGVCGKEEKLNQEFGWEAWTRTRIIRSRI